MTDDRARRIRDIRNRSKGESDESDDSTVDAESESDVEAETGAETDAATDGSGSDEATSNVESEPDDASGTNESSAGTDDGDERDATDEADREQGKGQEQDRGDAEQPTAEPTTDDADGEALSYDETETTGTEEPLEQTAAERTEPEPAADAGGAAIANGNAATTGIGAGTGTGTETTDGVSEASLQGAIAGMSDTVTVDERVGEATVDSTAIMDADTYGDAADREEVFDRGDSLIASTHNEEDTVQMLEFYLNDNRYAIEIGRVSAIVEMKDITRFPRGPKAIDGVTDLRGEITGVLDPTVMLDVERSEPSEDHYIVVIERDGDKQKLGIRVTDVSQAVTYRESQIDETGTVMDGTDAQHEFVEGIIKKNVDDGTALVAWLDIDSLIETTETEYTPSDYVRN
ncbi:chemotaxis protein CheW [Halopiger xanaduensis]|uniref:CheW protein n=1 Tax=Halopiger xanaduensis (strain DSM 18323 / JCM 14033 / SH-6) TaxID=797210 RepID=F8D9M8_HALXS|nr:chemotaxis protein CheW [Halopiger xanaduensis]AEH38122.1 CheW protein [Halopiger xanaduensis SH-6]